MTTAEEKRTILTTLLAIFATVRRTVKGAGGSVCENRERVRTVFSFKVCGRATPATGTKKARFPFWGTRFLYAIF